MANLKPKTFYAAKALVAAALPSSFQCGGARRGAGPRVGRAFINRDLPGQEPGKPFDSQGSPFLPAAQARPGDLARMTRPRPVRRGRKVR